MTARSPACTHALIDLDHLVQHAPDLAESKMPGTARPWSPPVVSQEKRAERAHRDRLEREERERDNRGRGVVMGFTKAPMHVDVLDDLVELNMTAAELVEALVRYVPTVQTVGMVAQPLQPARALTYSEPRGGVVPISVPKAAVWSVYGDPRPMLLEVARLLPIADEYDQDIAKWVEARTKRLCEAIDRALRLIRHGSTLTAVCPFCRGVDEHHPAGGALTLRVEQITKARPASKTRPAVEEAWAVVCHGTCEPPAGKVGTWFHGHPAWRQSEWDWLAPQLLPANQSEGTSA